VADTGGHGGPDAAGVDAGGAFDLGAQITLCCPNRSRSMSAAFDDTGRRCRDFGCALPT
jgi:hypothetical protein